MENFYGLSEALQPLSDTLLATFSLYTFYADGFDF